MTSVARLIVGLVALSYAYGAVVHVLNIFSMTGFDWVSAPIKWQVLDIIYLILDVIVVLGLILGWKTGYVAFYIAGISQIVLYSLLRDWIVDVPPEFAVSGEQHSYLTGLIVFHVITLSLITFCVRARSYTGLFHRTAPGSSQ